MEFGNLEFDWDIDSKNIWDFSPQNLKLLENSLLDAVFGFEDTPDNFEHNHIQIEHDYFNRHFCEETTNEVKTGQNNCSSEETLMKPKKKPSVYKISSKKCQRTLLKSNCDDDINHLSKSEQKSLKKFVRKMKNRVRRRIILFSLQILIFQVSAQESRKKKKEYMDSLEYNYKMMEEETNNLKKICQKMEREHQDLKDTIEILKCNLDVLKCLAC